MKGNVAIAEAAIAAGCQCFFGYPITPQNEIPEHMSLRMPALGRTFVQSESEVAAINMVHGAAGSGARTMTSSSGPGMSLKQEGISFLAGAELPCVIVNVMRGGPGLGGIQPAQADYYQSVKGGGHGDYELLVYAPSTVQEAIDLTQKAFYVADKYRIPVVILADGVLGQMMEPAVINTVVEEPLPEKTWATTSIGNSNRKPNVANSLYLDPEKLEKHILKLDEKFKVITKNEIMVEYTNIEDAEIIVVAYGTTARIVRSAIDTLKADGINVGLIRPITLNPFPYEEINAKCKNVNSVLVVEMSLGQMIDDVKIAIKGEKPINFYGRQGGIIPKAKDIVAEIKKLRG